MNRAAMLSTLVVAVLGASPHVAAATRPAGPGEDVAASCVPGVNQFEMTIRVNPANPLHIVAACRNDESPHHLVETFASFDGGRTFQCGKVDVEPTFIAVADPILVFDTLGGVHLFVLQVADSSTFLYGIYAYHSSDGGVTYGAAKAIEVFARTDKPQAAVCFTPGPRYGDIALTWTRQDVFGTGEGEIVVAISDDQGAIWSTPKTVNGKNKNGRRAGRFSDVAWGPQGELYVTWNDYETHDIRCDRSDDGGFTWGKDVKVDDYVEVPAKEYRRTPVFPIDVDTTAGPFSGRPYIVYHTLVRRSSGDHADVRCATSIDGGQSWSSVVVNAGDSTRADQFMPEVDVDSQGAVNVLWIDDRNDTTGSTYEYFGGRSLDGGLTFSEYVLSDVPFDTTMPGTFGPQDYNGIDSTATLAYACWGDCRSGADLFDLWVDPWVTGLTASGSTLSAATGGTIDVAITPGPNLGARCYCVLASLSGSDPGFEIDGIHVPLVWDALTRFSLELANGPMFQASLGPLDVNGAASMRLDSLGPFDPAFVGLDVTLAAIVFEPSNVVIHATGPVSIELTP